MSALTTGEHIIAVAILTNIAMNLEGDLTKLTPKQMLFLLQMIKGLTKTYGEQ